MRDRESIDAELRLIALARQSGRERGGQPSYRKVDDLLDERLGHRPEPSGTDAVAAGETRVAAVRPRRRKPLLLRFGPLMALPLSLLAAAALVVMFVVHKPPPSEEPTVNPPSAAPAQPVVPKAPAPTIDIADMAFIAALQHDGLPVPNQEYVTTHGRAVCDFLAHQANFTEAADFVQRSTIWDAPQSADFTAGAIVSYCPQYQAASTDQMQQAYQNALSNLQAVEGNLQGIQDHLHGIQDHLPGIPGHQ